MLKVDGPPPVPTMFTVSRPSATLIGRGADCSLTAVTKCAASSARKRPSRYPKTAPTSAGRKSLSCPKNSRKSSVVSPDEDIIFSNAVIIATSSQLIRLAVEGLTEDRAVLPQRLSAPSG